MKIIKIVFTVFVLYYSSNLFAEGKLIIESLSSSNELLVKGDGGMSYKITTKHSQELGGKSYITPIYGMLTSRGKLTKQPEAFDDITGDGNPDVLILELPDRITNSPVRNAVLRLFSVIDDDIKESRPYLTEIGEVIYFDDFNKDGTLEIVKTDGARYFLYSKSGMPISNYVLIFDTGYEHFYPAAKMLQ